MRFHHEQIQEGRHDYDYAKRLLFLLRTKLDPYPDPLDTAMRVQFTHRFNAFFDDSRNAEIEINLSSEDELHALFLEIQAYDIETVVLFQAERAA